MIMNRRDRISVATSQHKARQDLVNLQGLTEATTSFAWIQPQPSVGQSHPGRRFVLSGKMVSCSVKKAATVIRKVKKRSKYFSRQQQTSTDGSRTIVDLTQLLNQNVIWCCSHQVEAHLIEDINYRPLTQTRPEKVFGFDSWKAEPHRRKFHWSQTRVRTGLGPRDSPSSRKVGRWIAMISSTRRSENSDRSRCLLSKWRDQITEVEQKKRKKVRW